MPRFKRIALFLQAVAALAVLPAATAQITRIANTTLAMPQTPQTFGYRTENAFNTLTFDQPVAIVTPPGETARIFIVEKTARIQVVTNLDATTPTKQLFFDLTSRISMGANTEEGLLGLAFHPQFATNGYFYVFYTVSTTTSAGSGRHDRISRFTALPSPSTNADILATEVPLISQRDEASNHNGGDLHFGNDGYLYIALGDEGGGNDQYNNSQRIAQDFFSGLLRIDVDQRPENLLPNAHASVHAGTYRIPADNPFVGATSFNGSPVTASAVRTEFWAVGLRNPWRFSFDRPTGRLFVGDVGQSAREEIDLITRGGNYGWSYREGKIAGPRASPPGGVSFIDPIWDVDRNTASSITGGVVYRGTRFAQLFGSYVFGDYGQNRIFAMTFPEGGGDPQVTQITTASGPVGFGADPRNGDVLIANINNGTVTRLLYNSTPTGTPIPTTLTATGAFSDLATLTPAAGIVPYEPNVAFWSDHAKKRRWFSVPAIADKITFSADGNYTFPAGTVWVKHFDLELTRGNPSTSRRLETRLLVKTSTGLYGVTYRWNAQQTEASLVAEAGENEVITVTENGTPRPQTWRYPSRSECLQCHTPAGGHALSFNTAQLNRSATYNGTPANQLTALAAAGYFTTATVPSPATLPTLAPADDATASLEKRTRSYLAANCVQCHQPGGAAQGLWDARFSTSTASAGLINGALVNNFSDSANRVIAPANTAHSMLLTRISTRGAHQMPPLASNELDTSAINLLTAWIAELGLATINTQPTSTTVAENAPASFTLSATSPLTISYQWRKNGQPIPGATTATLFFTNATPADTASYDVVLTTTSGSVTSTAVTLTVAQSFTNWATSAALPSNQNTPTDDPDRDGASNLLEYALGLNPTSPSATALPSAQNENGQVIFRFTRSRSATGVTLQTFISADLVNWTPGPSPIVESTTAATETCTVALPSSQARHFLRLEATGP
ncbi:MAG: PQQ-dependent sugar dehydrogenase [Nibricoccus sp.]